MCGSARKDSRSGTDKLLSAISLNLGEGTDNLTRWHLIPVSYWWDGARLLTATFEGSRTLRNVRAQPMVRAAVGSTGDVLMIDATAAIVAADDVDEAAAEGYAQASGLPRSARPAEKYANQHESPRGDHPGV